MQRLTEQEKVRIAELSALGLPSRLIGKQIGRHHRTVWGYISRSRRKPLAPRSRSPLRLSLLEREEISRGLAEGRSLRSVAAGLGRSPSTVCREVARNGGRRRYRAARAEDRAWVRGRRPKVTKLAVHAELRTAVQDRLVLRWSPQQIAGWLREEFPGRAEMRVSHETIYLSLFLQGRGTLRKELHAYLRRGHATRRPRGYTTYNGQGKLRDIVHISERPAEAEDRAVPGHWEGDLLLGTSASCIATLVERQSRFVMLVKIPGRRTSELVTTALASEDPGPAHGTVQVVDLGPGQGDERARAVHHRHRRPGLLL